MRSAIVTVPPYAPFLNEVAAHPAVCGLRLNTVMPVQEPLDELLYRLSGIAKEHGKSFSVDLKCRQLRVKTAGTPPFTEIELTHEINVDVPVTAYFSDGSQAATVIGVDGNRLLMLDGPEKIVGPGESVNIPHPSLEVHGYLTDLDKEYLAAGKEVGQNDFILSFVERPEDIECVRDIHPDANIIAKIESRKGLEYVKNSYDGEVRLMAGRGDLYTEIKRPHHILKALEDIVTADKDAIAASRIFPSLVHSYEPACEDIGDLDNLLRMGYRTVMFGDHICMQRNRILNGLNLFKAVAQGYPKQR